MFLPAALSKINTYKEKSPSSLKNKILSKNIARFLLGTLAVLNQSGRYFAYAYGLKRISLQNCLSVMHVQCKYFNI